MKTMKLEFEYEYDFDLLAIISSAKEYKLAWAINKHLGLDFEKQDDILFEFVKEGRMFISNFLDEYEYCTLRMLKNKSAEFSNIAKPYLLSELKNYDYLLQLEGEQEEFQTADLLQGLKTITDIQYVTQVDIDALKSKENLIF